MVMDNVDEQIDTMGKAFLGLTLGCARCHDHKFDPIPTRDYYGLAGIFKSTRTMATLATVARVLERPLPGPPPDPSTGGKPAPAAATCIAVEEEKQPGEVRVHLRGNHLTLGEPAPRIFPRILAGEHQVPVPPGRSGRLELAEWLTRRENPLTARVIVNRVWQHHFGEGLVRTPDNFGKLGDRPSHPELLDWLADRFTAPASEPHGCGWSLKRLHRLILTTQAYRMSTAYDARAARADPDNRLLWRFHRRRLEVEAIRDGILAVSGTLDRTMGGSLLTTPNFGYVTNDQSANAARYDSPRRSLYLPVIRNAVYDVFQVFDFVEPSIENGKRSSTTVAPQALFLLNGSFMLAQSRALAERMLREAGDDPARLERAFRLAYGRPPSAPERAELLGYLREYAARLSSSESDPARRRLLAWQSVAQILFASSEFVYVE
jgi:hypothetical protein